MARSRRRARRNPASKRPSAREASAFQPSERVTLAGSASRRASGAASSGRPASKRPASGRPAPRPRPDRVASDRASKRPSSKAASRKSSVAASAPAKKSKVPMVLGLLGGAAVLGGLAWWLLSRKAQAAEAGQLTREEIYRASPRGRGIELKPFSPKAAKAAKETAQAEGRTFYLPSKQAWISKEQADALIATGEFHLGREGRNVMRTYLAQPLSPDARSLLANL